MDTTKLLEERARARAAKRQADAELYSFHEHAIAALLDHVHGHDVRVQALATIALWERERLCHVRYIAAWRAILAQPPAAVSAAILRADDEGVVLRQNTPFGFLRRAAG